MKRPSQLSSTQNAPLLFTDWLYCYRLLLISTSARALQRRDPTDRTRAALSLASRTQLPSARGGVRRERVDTPGGI